VAAACPSRGCPPGLGSSVSRCPVEQERFPLGTEAPRARSFSFASGSGVGAEGGAPGAAPSGAGERGSGALVAPRERVSGGR